MFAISVITYFFFTSWFIFYGCYLIGKKIDEKLASGEKKNRFLRFIIFFGGLALSLLFLYLFIIGPTLFDFSIILETPLAVPWYLNGIYLIVGGVLIGLTIICIVYMFKKSFNGWFGIFAILVSFYTLFLVLKIYMGLVGTGTDQEELSTIWAYLGIIIPDLFIIFYSLSTLMGSQAELLSKRLKRFGMDTVIIWLILSKVTYEFIHFFPYEIFSAINIPWLNFLSQVDNDAINFWKNVAVLVFFILLLVIIGIYEIHKYHKERKEPKKEEKEEEIEPSLPETSTYEPQPNIEEDSLEGLDPGDYQENYENNFENSNNDV